ncbi:unnamed protein product [Thelazia callipaeda]|uniref:Uncharacterized protein n=1 Tax=Thelazia callipaeda TaxID=103827 RepID=A0A0N5D609_THECL|nr:unnamed protein product [Thelazia callipaeda]
MIKKKKDRAKEGGQFDLSQQIALNQKAKSVISEVLKKQTKDLDKTQVEAPKDDEENSNTFNFDKVRWLGNLDDIMKEQKSKTIKEIEDMKSFHEMETFEPLQPVTDSQLHVKIAEKKSRLYETDNDESIDEETNETLL